MSIIIRKNFFNKFYKSYKHEGVNIAFHELKSMSRIFVFGNLALFLVLGLFCLVSDFNILDWRIYFGMFCGNALVISNFLLIGFFTEKILSRKKFEKGQRFASIAFAVRYIGLSAIMAFLLATRAVNIFAMIFPLFFPRIYYFARALSLKK